MSFIDIYLDKLHRNDMELDLASSVLPKDSPTKSLYFEVDLQLQLFELDSMDSLDNKLEFVATA